MIGRLGAGQRTALQAVLGIGGGVLIGDLALGEALNGDAEPGLVHHHEHRGEALVLLPDQEAFGVVVIHHAGRIGVNAHLVLDGAAGDAVARADRAVGVDRVARHDEQRDALDARRRALDAGEHQMDDVLGNVLLAGRDEDLLAGDRIGAVALRDSLGLEQAEIGAAMGLGQVHGPGPHALDHPGQIGLLLLVRAMHLNGGHRAHGQAGIHREGHVRGRRELVHDRAERVGQALPAMVGVSRQPDPAPLRIGLVRRLKTLGRLHRAVVEALRAFLIAGEVERLEGLLAQLGALA